jgi:serine/threonine protein kinase
MSRTIVVGQHYELRTDAKIGSGSYGDIYYAVDRSTREVLAAKLERTNQRRPHLPLEHDLYRKLSGAVGFPTVYWYGTEGVYNILIMQCLGPSLEDLVSKRHKRGGYFSLQTVLKIADQALQRLSYVHAQGYIHRDIKPDNFLVGRQRQKQTIYLVDFGLAKPYRHYRTQTHIRYKENKHLTGTPRYASLYNHRGIEQSRRDDLISLGYMLVYLAQGELPWQKVHSRGKTHRRRKIYETKRDTSHGDLCHGLPKEFCDYFTYCERLRFMEQPDYAYLRRLFALVAEQEPNPYGDLLPFDWEGSDPESDSSDDDDNNNDDSVSHHHSVSQTVTQDTLSAADTE